MGEMPLAAAETSGRLFVLRTPGPAAVTGRTDWKSVETQCRPAAS